MSDQNNPPSSPYSFDPDDVGDLPGGRRAAGWDADALPGWTSQGSADAGPYAPSTPSSAGPDYAGGPSGGPSGPPPGPPPGGPQGPPPQGPYYPPPGPSGGLYGPPPQGPPPGQPPGPPPGPPPGYPPSGGPSGAPYSPPNPPGPPGPEGPYGPPGQPGQPGEEPPPWAGLPPSPPARRQAAADVPAGGLDDDLDFDEDSKRRWPIILIAAVVVAVLGVGGYFGYRTWLADDRASADPTSEPTEEPTGEPTGEPTDKPTDEPTEEPPPEGEAAVRQAIEDLGLECYDTLSEPAPTVTCYGIIDNASSMTLAYQHADDEITVLRLDASISPTNPGPSIEAYSRIAGGVADAVLDGEGIPLITEGEREADVPWGHVRQNVSGTGAAIIFTKKDAEPARANSRPLEPGVERLQTLLASEGFECKNDRCELVTGEGAAAVTVAVDIGSHNVRMEFVPGKKAEPLPEEEVTRLMFLLTDAVMPQSTDAVHEWFESHKKPQLQRADFDGVRISMLWNDGTDPAMTLAAASAWPYEN